MKVIAFNGSPRKEWNTATLLKNVLEGAASKGAGTELIHLYDLKYQGCISCFACKEKGGKSYGRCAVKDELTPVLRQIEQADALVFGSPVYLGGISGQLQSFMERLIFQYLTYTNPPGTLFAKKIPTGCVYAMGMTEELMAQAGYPQRFANIQRLLTLIFGSSEMVLAFDAYQFADYSKIVAPRFDPVAKLKRKNEVFPLECRQAFEMGMKLVK